MKLIEPIKIILKYHGQLGIKIPNRNLITLAEMYQKAQEIETNQWMKV